MANNPYKQADHFTRKAKDQGFQARSVFKLEEIQRRTRILKPGQRVVDLGCYPGSWSQYLRRCVGRKGAVVGVDLSEPTVGGATWIEANVMDVSAEQLRAALGGDADVVLSDMAPNTTGVAYTDHVRQLELARRALALAIELLVPGGAFVVKVFDGEEVPAYQAEVRAHFGKVRRIRPEATRQVSREFFLVGLDRR